MKKPVTRAEIDFLSDKIAALIKKDPAKAARLLQDWINRPRGAKPHKRSA